MHCKYKMADNAELCNASDARIINFCIIIIIIIIIIWFFMAH